MYFLLFHFWQELWNNGRRLSCRRRMLIRWSRRTLGGSVVVRGSGFQSVAIRWRSVLTGQRRNFRSLDRKHRRVGPGSGSEKPDRFVRVRFRILCLELCSAVCDGTCKENIIKFKKVPRPGAGGEPGIFLVFVYFISLKQRLRPLGYSAPQTLLS